MKKLKALLVAMTMTLTAMCSGGFTASAATYDPCDVDRDGEVTILDVVSVNRYIVGGIYHEEEYNRFDADRNLIVDISDSFCILAKLVDNSYSNKYYSRTTGKYYSAPSVSTFIPDREASDTSSRWYLKRTSKGVVTSYELEPGTVDIDTETKSNMSKIVIGDDTRKKSTSEENTGIVYLRTPTSSGFKFGTGFVVGDHQIATAAHCVCDTETDQWLDPMVVLYGADGKLTNRALNVVEYHIPKSYYDLSKSSSWCDYALITVKDDLSDLTHFSIGTSYNVDENTFKNVPLYVTGCPDGVDGITNSKFSLYSAEGHIVKDELYNKASLFFDVDTSYGQSGSPVYVITDRKAGNETVRMYVALGVLSGYYDKKSGIGPINVASRMLKYHQQFYANNPNMSWE